MDDSAKGKILLESGTNELEVMEFMIADRHFGINVSKVENILRYNYETKITPMPNSNPFVEGVFKPRDIIITVIDLAAYLGLPPSENIEKDILIITNFNKTKTAFHAHSIEGIYKISWEDIDKPDSAIYGGEEGLATGIARYNDRLITIIDFEKILSEIDPSSSVMEKDIMRLERSRQSDKPILVAEDSALLERILLNALEKSGYNNIIITNNGREAWEKLMQFKEAGGDITDYVRCVITDIEMPQMDGHRLTKQIKDDPALSVLPVIIFSSLINEQMRLKGEQVGATAQLSKPEISDLISLVDKHIL